MGTLSKILLVALGCGLLYAGVRLVLLAFRLWRLGLAARGALAALIGAIYTLSPVDAVPDVIVGIGWIDDLIVLGMAALYVWRLLDQRGAGRRNNTGAGRPPASRPVMIPQLPPPR